MIYKSLIFRPARRTSKTKQVTSAGTLSPMETKRTRGQGLAELVDLVGVGNNVGVQVLGATDLELGHLARLLDIHA
jgi:hypothetical protein